MTIAAPRLLRVIDYETTGTPADPGAEVIEMAYVDIDASSHQVGAHWRSFAKPLGSIPPEVKAVHHILEEDLAHAPAIGNLWPMLFQGCGPQDCLCMTSAPVEQFCVIA